MKGLVRWYSHQGYGFIDPVPTADGNALYFHISDVPSRKVFKPGDPVIFDVVQVPKGSKCIHVRAADTKEAIQCPQTK